MILKLEWAKRNQLEFVNAINPMMAVVNKPHTIQSIEFRNLRFTISSTTTVSACVGIRYSIITSYLAFAIPS